MHQLISLKLVYSSVGVEEPPRLNNPAGIMSSGLDDKSEGAKIQDIMGQGQGFDLISGDSSGHRTVQLVVPTGQTRRVFGGTHSVPKT